MQCIGQTVPSYAHAQGSPMLRIHKEQLEFFGRKTQGNFVGRMAGYLREEYPDLVERVPDLEAWLQSTVDRSIGAQITTEPEVAQLAMLFLAIGMDSAPHAHWIEPILRDRDLLPVGKVRTLIREARERGVEHIDAIDITDTLEDV